MKPIVFFSLLLVISSCAFHTGSLNSSIPPSPVIHKDIAIGVSKTTKFIGLGGLFRDAIIFEARQNMITNRPLVGNESYNNITTDVKNMYFLCIMRTKVTMIADVVAPKDSINQTSYSPIYLQKVTKGNERKDSLFHIGDSVFTYHGNSGVIVNFEGAKKQKARLQLSQSGKIRTRVISLNKLFVIIPTYRGLELGFYSRNGKYIAFGREGALAFDGSSYIIDFYKEKK